MNDTKDNYIEMRSFANNPENLEALHAFYRQKMEIKRDAIIDSWNVRTKHKNVLKAIIPYDALAAYEIVDGRPEWIKVILDLKKKIVHPSNKYESLSDDPYYGYRFCLKALIKKLQNGIDEICEKEINKVEGHEIEHLKKCYKHRSDLMDAAKKAEIETFLLPQLFEKINTVIHPISQIKYKFILTAKEQNEEFKPQGYGQPLKMIKLLEKFPVCDRKIYRFIAGEKIKKSPMIKQIQRGIYCIKNNCETKIRESLKL